MARRLIKTTRAYLANPPAHDPIRAPTLSVICTAGGGITVLNYFWFYKMIRGAIHVFSRPVGGEHLAVASAATGDDVAVEEDAVEMQRLAAPVDAELTAEMEVIDIPADP